MAEPPIPPLPPPSPPSFMPMLYYSLIIIATIAGLLAVYNLIIMKCGNNYSSYAADRISRAPTAGSITSFKYKSDGGGGGGGANIDNECSVCLSVFEEGDELKQLPNCKHRFHAPCIDMWLYSHTSCPLCRTTVAVAVAVAAAAPAMIHPREALVGPAVMV